MNNVKKDLNQEIESRIQKKKLAKERASRNTTLEGFIINFIKNIEELNSIFDNDVDWAISIENAKQLLINQLKTLDPNVRLKIKWRKEENETSFVDSVCIKWSEKYQKLNNAEPELNISALDILLIRRD